MRFNRASFLVWALLCSTLLAIVSWAASADDLEGAAALATLEAARARVRANPADGGARLALGMLYVERANWTDARSELEVALTHLPSGADSLRAAHLHARSLLSLGLKMRATRALAELSRRPGAPAGALHDLALLWEQDQFGTEALALEMEAVERAPEDAISLRQAAASWKARGHLEQSYLLLERLEGVGLAESEDLFQLGLMAHRLGDYERARNAYEACLAKDPTHPEACYNLALVLREHHEPDASIASFERVLTLRPKYEPAYFELGGYLLELGRKDAAQIVFERYLVAGEDTLAMEEARDILHQLKTGENPWADPAADSLRQILGYTR